MNITLVEKGLDIDTEWEREKIIDHLHDEYLRNNRHEISGDYFIHEIISLGNDIAQWADGYYFRFSFNGKKRDSKLTKLVRIKKNAYYEDEHKTLFKRHWWN